MGNIRSAGIYLKLTGHDEPLATFHG